ncbi:MAG: 4a-hydroxytetrahydrobiopterin dehydratase [Candidatus Saccharibacteria bacterium]
MEKPTPLSEDAIKQALERLPGWSYGDDKLVKEFAFTDFVDSLSFINSLVAYFETMDHHPDVHIFYNKIKFELTRYDAGGKVTDRDLEVAKKIEETYAGRK